MEENPLSKRFEYQQKTFFYSSLIFIAWSVFGYWPQGIPKLPFILIAFVFLIRSWHYVWGRHMSARKKTIWAVGLTLTTFIGTSLVALIAIGVVAAIIFLLSILSVSPGRPLRDERKKVISFRSTQRDDWVLSDFSSHAGVDPKKGERWLKDALMEYSAAAAFSKLSYELTLRGAPPELIHGSLDAGKDEIKHAQLCFTMASKYLGKKTGPEANAVLTKEDKARMVHENLHDGISNEGRASLLAGIQKHLEKDVDAKKVYSEIASDESRHAHLAIRIHQWLKSQ